MKRFSKISIDDIKTIQVDSGVLLKEFDVENPVFLPENVICATSGGINPVCVPEYYDFGEDVDNAKSAKETKRIRGWNATISFTTLTTSLAAIKLALGAADISGKVLNLRQRLQYAKDFSDIWWVGKRADDKLLAIRLIRSLSDSGFSLQTNKRGKGQISVTLKGHCSFSDIKKVPMEIYVLAEVPTATLYLYGTPSKVSYNGVELPDIEAVWDKETYTKAYVCEVIDGAWGLCTLNGEMYHESNGFIKANGQVQGRIYVFATTEAAAELLEVKVGEWTLVEEDTMEDGSTVESLDILWTSHDILNADGSVYLAASEPVYSGNIGLRVGESVTYYEGAVLSKLPEEPEYECVTVLNNDGTYLANFTSSGQNAYNTGGVAVTPAVPLYKYEDGQWVKAYYTMNAGVYPVVWANYDLYYKTAEEYGELSGTLCKATSDPIPVSGIVGCSYSGTVLPVLPESDLPYAYILSSFGTTYLFYTEAAVDFRYVPSFGYMLVNTIDGKNVNFNHERYELIDGSWGNLYTANSYFALGSNEGMTIWCNEDLYHYDKDTGEATQVLSACPEPIPVYE